MRLIFLEDAARRRSCPSLHRCNFDVRLTQSLAGFSTQRPIAGIKLAMAMAIAMDLAGLLAWRTLSVAPLPQVNFPIIEVRPPSKVAPAPW